MKNEGLMYNILSSSCYEKKHPL